jgi:hypothetical protein
MSVKVYALGIYAEVSRGQKSLEALKGKADGNPDLFAAFCNPDPAAFFGRALHKVFARSVTGAQVTDALAEKLVKVLSPETFKHFSTTLLGGIGPKGLSTGETLTFFWPSPEELRILVRGQVAGDIKGGSELPKALHRGFLGPDPAIPELKLSVAKGLPRLFHGGAAAAAGGGVGANPRRAGTPVRPTTVTEPASGLPMPTGPTFAAFSPPGGNEASSNKPTPMRLLGCGVRVKKLGFIEVQVYAVGIFVEPEGAKRELAPWAKASSTGNNAQPLFASLLSTDPAAFYGRALHMVFARSVSGKQVADALGEKLAKIVTPEVFAQFCSTLLEGIGPNGLNKGESLSFFWCRIDALRIYVRGTPTGEVSDALLPKAIHSGFLGDDPGAPEAKTQVPRGAAALLAE